MSAYSTLRFSRKKAIDRIVSIVQAPHTPNETLEKILDVLLERELYNSIVSDFEEDD